MKELNAILALIIFVCHVSGASSDLGCFPFTKSPFKIYNIKQGKKNNKCKLHPDLASSLKANGFTKVVCPFGILMVATQKYPDEVSECVYYSLTLIEKL
jgi:hypothetical protein